MRLPSPQALLIGLIFVPTACAAPVRVQAVDCAVPVAASALAGARLSLGVEVARPAEEAPAGASANPETPAAGERVYVTDVGGHPLPGLQSALTDAAGRARLPNLPADTAFVVTVPVRQRSGAAIALKTMVRTGSSGELTVPINLATTLATEAATAGGAGQLLDFNVATFEQAVSRLQVRLQLRRAPDLSDRAAVTAWLETAMREDEALGRAVATLREGATRARPTPRPSTAVASPAPAPSASPTPAATASEVATVSTQLLEPYNVAPDGHGHLLVAHQRGVSRLTATGVESLGPGGETGKTCYGVAVDAAGRIYVSDAEARTIRRLDANGLSTTLATAQSAGAAGGVGTPVTFQPWGLAVDAAGGLVFADYANHCIRRIGPDGVVTTVAGTGSPGHQDGPAAEAAFSFPMNVAIDAAGAIYVTDSQAGYVRRIAPDGAVSTVAQLLNPAGITLDGQGVLHVTSFGSHRVLRLNADGSSELVAGGGEFGWKGGGFADGSRATALFARPFGLMADGSALYVADTGNHRVRRIR